MNHENTLWSGFGEEKNLNRSRKDRKARSTKLRASKRMLRDLCLGYQTKITQRFSRDLKKLSIECGSSGLLASILHGRLLGEFLTGVFTLSLSKGITRRKFAQHFLFCGEPVKQPMDPLRALRLLFKFFGLVPAMPGYD